MRNKMIQKISALTLLAALIACTGAVAEAVPPCPTIGVKTGLVGDEGDTTGRLMGLTIGIDAGHQGKANSEHEPVAPGSRATKPKVSAGTQGVNSKIPEHEVNLQVAMKLKEALVKEGAKVVMVRETSDVNISNVERAVMMNDAKADLVLRIHCNAAQSASPKGLALYVRKSGTRAQECDAAAQVLIEAMIENTGAKNRGVVHSDDYSGLNWSEVPSILVEMGFLTNPEEDALLTSGDYQDKMVSGMVEGIARYFEK